MELLSENHVIDIFTLIPASDAGKRQLQSWQQFVSS